MAKRTVNESLVCKTFKVTMNCYAEPGEAQYVITTPDKFLEVFKDSQDLNECGITQMVFLGGQAEMAERWLTAHRAGIGAVVALHALQDPAVEISLLSSEEADDNLTMPKGEIAEARRILQSLHSAGELDYLPHEATYEALTRVEALLGKAEALMH